MLRVQFEEDLEKLHNQFYAMGNEVLTQINRTVRAFVTHDRDLARQVIEDDAEINEYYDRIQELATEEIKHNPDLIITGRDYFQVINYLERIGDYAKNICEWVVYFETGKIVEL